MRTQVDLRSRPDSLVYDSTVHTEHGAADQGRSTERSRTRSFRFSLLVLSRPLDEANKAKGPRASSVLSDGRGLLSFSSLSLFRSPPPSFSLFPYLFVLPHLGRGPSTVYDPRPTFSFSVCATTIGTITNHHRHFPRGSTSTATFLSLAGLRSPAVYRIPVHKFVCTHARTYARTHARTHVRTRARVFSDLPRPPASISTRSYLAEPKPLRFALGEFPE